MTATIIEDTVEDLRRRLTGKTPRYLMKVASESGLAYPTVEHFVTQRHRRANLRTSTLCALLRAVDRIEQDALETDHAHTAE